MPLDTELIRARLASVNQERWARNTEPAIDPRFPLGTFIAHAPTDIAALLSEVDRLTAENEALRAEVDRWKRRAGYRGAEPNIDY
jgi:hypothetical protein